MAKMKNLVRSVLKGTTPGVESLDEDSYSLDDLYLGNTNYRLSEAYKRSVWAFACIRNKAQNLSALPLIIRNKKSLKEVDYGPSFDLFNKVNPVSNKNHLIEGVSTFMDLKGESFLILDGKLPNSKWAFFWNKDPGLMNPVITGGQITAWQYISGSARKTFAPEQVLHFKYFNPYDEIRGFTPVQALQATLEHENYAREYNAAFFKNAGTASLALTFQETLSKKEKERIKASFNMNHGGWRKAFKLLILDSKGDVKQMNPTLKDMMFIEALKLSREETCAVYRVPPAEIGILEYANYANMDQQSINYWTKTLMPEADYLLEVFNTKYFDVYDQENEVVMDFSGVDVLQMLLANKLKMAIDMFTIGYAIDIIDEKLGINFLPSSGSGKGGAIQGRKWLTWQRRKAA